MREAKLTAANLAALEKSNPSDMTLRLIRGIREAWRERDEAVGSLAMERADLEQRAQEIHEAEAKLKEFDKERAIVVIYPDGFVEVYASKYGLDVHIETIDPLEDEREWEKRVPHAYKDLAMPGKVKGYGQCAVRPTLTDEALAQILRADAMRDLSVIFEQYLEARKG